MYSLEPWQALVFALIQKVRKITQRVVQLRTCLWNDTDALTDKRRGDSDHDAVHKLTAIVSFEGMEKAGKNA